ncbi:hypothetical protein L1049_011922 [Liquidambar formosana]|uniref:Uncharacterized protein n=1 Tax=Liquidambar formosana TaxID=63359 RepID=A0AAP0WYF2_LIQFO
MSHSESSPVSASTLPSFSSSPIQFSGSFSHGVTGRCRHRFSKIRKSGKNRCEGCSSEPPTFNMSNAVSSTFVFGNGAPLSVLSPFGQMNLSDASGSTGFGSPISVPTNVAPVSTSGDSSSERQTELLPEKTTEVVKFNHAENGNSRLQSNSHLPLTVVSKFLKGIPQNPHFLQLRRHSQLVKKNLISGWDQTFEETVDQIHALRAVDFWVRARELWRALEELQSLGYNVLLLRRRLVELTDVMMELKSSKCKILGLKNKAESHRMEKSRLESEILNLKSQVQREQISIEEALKNVVEMENEIPRFDGVFANLATKPL